MALRRFLLPALALCGLLSAAVHPALPEVKRVYLLPMSNGLDQYLANRLTKGGRFEVVTDPAKADAVFTDRLGTSFEERWNELYPPPPPPEKPADTKAKDAKDTKEAKDKSAAVDLTEGRSPTVRVSSFNKGKGNVFLVSRKTNSVVWSHFATPKNTRSKTLDHTADRIVDRLQDDVNPKK
jgi:hypothetical protein